MKTSEFATGFHRGIVDRFEDISIQLLSFFALERETHQTECISQTLNTDTNGSMTKVRCFRLAKYRKMNSYSAIQRASYFQQRIEVHIDDSVQIANDDTRHLNEFIEIEGSIGSDESVQSDRRQIADSDLNGSAAVCRTSSNAYLIRCGVFDDFCAQIRTMNCSEMLLIALGIAMIFVEHERRSRLDLSIDDSEPKILSFDGATSQTFLFVSILERTVQRFDLRTLSLVPGVEIVEFFAPDILQVFALMGTHQRPFVIGLDASHEQIGNPQGREEIASAFLFGTGVLAGIEKIEDIGVPRFQIQSIST